MSERVNLDMYGNEETEAVPQPVLISKNRVSLTSFGKMQSMEVDGNRVLIADPQWIEELERKVQQTTQTCVDLHNRLIRANSNLAKLTQKVDILSKQLDRITGDS
jgi:hypothetical protein